MRRARHLLWTLALATLAAAPAAHATSVTVLLSGEWFQVTDNANATGGSIAVGIPFTVTLTYDDGASDLNADPTIGDYVLPGATSSLTLATGGFAFTLGATEDILFGVGDGLIGQDDFLWFAENFSTSGPLPVGVTTGYGFMSPQVADSTATAHDSDDLTGLPWDISAYNSPNFGMYFLIAVCTSQTPCTSSGGQSFIKLFGEF